MAKSPEKDNLFDLEEGKKRKGILRRLRLPRFSFRIGIIGKLLILAVIVVVGFYKSLFVYVGPNEFGIKEVRIGLHRGVQEEVYTTGFHLVVPMMWRMHRLPRDIQVLELTNHRKNASKFARLARAAHIQTSDGFFVDVDVSIIYRITDPYKVFTTIGPGRLYEDNGIIPKAEPALKDSLGDLTTEEFFNSHLRVEKSEQTKRKLNTELALKGLTVEQVLVRYFRYSDEIQKNIEEKKLKDQLVFKNQAEARAAIEKAVLTKIEQEGKVTVSVELEKGSAYVTKKRAEKDLYFRKKTAEADMLVKLAEAEKVRLKNEALQGKGAERMVGMKMADVYRGLNLIVLPSDGVAGVNPLNLNNALELFDVRKGGE